MSNPPALPHLFNNRLVPVFIPVSIEIGINSVREKLAILEQRKQDLLKQGEELLEDPYFPISAFKAIESKLRINKRNIELQLKRKETYKADLRSYEQKYLNNYRTCKSTYIPSLISDDQLYEAVSSIGEVTSYSKKHYQTAIDYYLKEKKFLESQLETVRDNIILFHEVNTRYYIISNTIHIYIFVLGYMEDYNRIPTQKEIDSFIELNIINTTQE